MNTEKKIRPKRNRALDAINPIAGNPIMHHLFLGLDPTELGVAPFALTIDSGCETHASACGLAIAPGAHVCACRASPAMSVPTRPAPHSPRHPI
jgi:uncharacterized 2Fe-2S/4Fe-4S cluster protein (DUF4445 family)